eukprot:TRINITY_DN17766_c0_g1_i3.p1 TRINITY_DN17766_c0_g1~~TRINITY_DN17766_c0_g1_i3.p1  ORF type:complete len:579 (+),score=124.41 TRINITY_DN17766_c0_g1_i3:69-1805(+)
MMALTILVGMLSGSMARSSSVPWSPKASSPAFLSQEDLRFFRDIGQGRHERLLQAKCLPESIWLFSPPTWEKFQECLTDGYKNESFDTSIVGSEVLIISQCWCSLGLTELIKAYGCCEHPSFRQWCQMDCNADCSSTEAKDCYSKCPNLCLEPDYAPEDCDCMESGCNKYSVCIAERAAQSTQDGTMSTICDDKEFHKSKELIEYETCVTEQPMRTNWHRHNAKAYCACRSGLKDSLGTHGCCGADWAAPTCNLTCKSEAQCESDAATKCLTGCRETCEQLHPTMITEDCIKACFEGPCKEYQTCAPLEPLAYEYSCENGDKPADNGCCPDANAYGKQSCPSMCGMRRSYLIHGQLHCQCFQCPTKEEEHQKALKDTLSNQVESSGGLLMKDVCSQVTLETCPTSSMQEMLKVRNNEINQMINDHSGMPNANLEQQIRVTASKHNARILLEAHRKQDCDAGKLDASECGDMPLELQKKGEEVKTEDNSMMLVIVIVVCAIILVLLAGALFFMCCRKPKRNPENQEGGIGLGGMAPMDGDDQVVVGRPVTADNDATAGAPVTSDPKAQPPATSKGGGDV